jgi:hypothetical protein
MEKQLDTRPKPFVFVLMPFSEDFRDIYENGIKAACEAAGAYCERVDEQVFQGGILQRVYNQIAKADIIVADMTGRNPNVFYETGYAHALGKQVILLTQRAEDIPFDLKDYPHVVYEGRIYKLKPELEKRVRWCIDNPLDRLTEVDSQLEVYVNEIRLETRQTTVIRAMHIGRESLRENTPAQFYADLSLRIVIHNPGGRLQHGPRQVGIEVPEAFGSDRTYTWKYVLSTNNYSLFTIDGPAQIVPNGWHGFQSFRSKSERKFIDNQQPLKVLLYTDLSTQQYDAILAYDDNSVDGLTDWRRAVRGTRTP